MPDSLPRPTALDIADVVRRTGLTSRALRFYEARGLLAPLRSASGRRFYGPAELARIHQIVTLKRAGLTLQQIQRLSGREPIDLARLIAAQCAALDAQAAEIAHARALLLSVSSRIDRSEPIDVATFCSLIEQGERLVTQQWDKVADRYFSADQQAQFREWMGKVPPDFDPADYAAKWADLGGRIKAALPLDPASDAAQAFVTEWNALLAPFQAVASPAMMTGVQKMYERMDEWDGEADPGFDQAVFAFIQRAQAVRR